MIVITHSATQHQHSLSPPVSCAKTFWGKTWQVPPEAHAHLTKNTAAQDPSGCLGYAWVGIRNNPLISIHISVD